ncbi:MAG: fused MFS/spermidine synthase, partial [Verrucomicrobiota bacterium]
SPRTRECRTRVALNQWFHWRPHSSHAVIILFALNGFLIAMLYRFFPGLHGWAIQRDQDAAIWMLSFCFMFPVSLISGAIFTMLGKLLHDHVGEETRSAGLLSVVNTGGAMLGSLLAGLVVMPLLGMEKSLLVCSVGYGIAALALFDRHLFVHTAFKPMPYIVSVVLLMFTVVGFPYGIMNNRLLAISGAEYQRDDRRQVYHREGLCHTVRYLQTDLMRQPYRRHLITNNHIMSETSVAARRYMKMYVYLPVALHPNPKRAALICFGCGSTAKALTDTANFESIDIIDISRDVLAASKVVFPNRDGNPLEDPRVDVHIEDGRFFLQTTDRTFDLITAEPPPPVDRGVANLYSREYFQLIRSRLAEGGMVTYWLPVNLLDTGQTKSILRAFIDVFPDATLWCGAGFDWMLLGVNEPLKSVSPEQFGRQWKDPVVGPEMQTLGLLNPDQFGALFMADAAQLEEWMGDHLPLVDNYPKRLTHRNYRPEESVPIYREFLSAQRCAANFAASPFIAEHWPEGLAERTRPYFVPQQTVNLMTATTSINMQFFHECLSNPVLQPYITWALGSDGDAQDILAARAHRFHFNSRLFNDEDRKQ